MMMMMWSLLKNYKLYDFKLPCEYKTIAIASFECVKICDDQPQIYDEDCEKCIQWLCSKIHRSAVSKIFYPKQVKNDTFPLKTSYGYVQLHNTKKYLPHKSIHTNA